MTGNEIRAKIDENNQLMTNALTPQFFTLNKIVANLMEENENLRKVCNHKFEDGICIYCDIEEEAE